MAGARAAQEQDGDDGLMNWTVYIAAQGERPEADLTAVAAAELAGKPGMPPNAPPTGSATKRSSPPCANTTGH